MAKNKAKRNGLLVVCGRAPDGGDDQRVFCRFALDGVSVRFKDLRAGERGEVLCCDIGGGGAGMMSRCEIKPRTPLELWFDLPDDHDALHLLGRVTWTMPDGDAWRLGVVFDRQRLLSLARVLRLDSERS